MLHGADRIFVPMPTAELRETVTKARLMGQGQNSIFLIEDDRCSQIKKMDLSNWLLDQCFSPESNKI